MDAVGLDDLASREGQQLARQGRRALRVRIVPAPGVTWSEYRYTAYAWTLPPAP